MNADTIKAALKKTSFADNKYLKALVNEPVLYEKPDYVASLFKLQPGKS